MLLRLSPMLLPCEQRELLLNTSAALSKRLAEHDCSAATAKHWSSQTAEDLRRTVPLMSMRRIAQGEHLFRAGESFQSLYLLQEGFVKIIQPRAEGASRICSFFVRGELIGAKSIGHTMYQCDAVALDDCSVWELPYSSVLATCSNNPALHAGLVRARVECTHRERKAMAAHDRAPERLLAELLLDLLSRYKAHGNPAGGFAVKLSASDIADYLGIERTDARLAIARLCTTGDVSCAEGELRVANADGLRAMAESASERRNVADAIG